MMRWLALTPLLWLLSACDAASVLEARNTIARNECQTNADCGNGVCDGSQCRSKNGSYPSVLLEVTPPADNTAIAGAQFLLPTELVAGGETALALAQISQVTGRVLATHRSCKPRFGDAGNEVAITSDTSMPALLSLIPVTEKLGLYSPRAVVQSEVNSDATFFGYSVNVPPGSYDIYVQPKYQPDQTCPIPPQLLLEQEVKAGAWQLDIDLPEPSTFEFHVSWSPGADTLDGWMVDMLVPASGQVISNRVPLVPVGKTSDGKTDYRATLTYSSVTVRSKQQPDQDQLLRLSPPSDLPVTEAKPTVLMARSALGLFKAGSGTLTAFSSLPTPVHVVGQVTSVGKVTEGGAAPRPVAATVTLAATEIDGIDKGVLVSFVRTVTVSDDGQPFDVYLLPGKYRVSTVPQLSLDPSNASDTTFAADVRSWTVPNSPAVQQGKLIELNPALALYGQVLDASNGPVTTAQVQATASPLSISRPDFLRESLEGSAFVPRATAGGVNSSGNFALKTDPGTFDITVRPNADTGFAWLVMPNVVIPAPNGLGLNTIRMPLPVPYSGTVAIAESSDVVPGALIRAYLYLKDGVYTTKDDANANSLLQVAETRAGSDGKFELLIPAELN